LSALWSFSLPFWLVGTVPPIYYSVIYFGLEAHSVPPDSARLYIGISTTLIWSPSPTR
jgi:hypothetical protein